MRIDVNLDQRGKWPDALKSHVRYWPPSDARKRSAHLLASFGSLVQAWPTLVIGEDGRKP